jgi:hypothetical protein
MKGVEGMDENFLEHLVVVGDYNGYLGDIKRIYDYIRAESIQANIPDWLTEEYEDCDNFIRVFWSVLVMAYGDYGTSPRFGWINKLEPCCKALEEVIRFRGEEEEENQTPS